MHTIDELARLIERYERDHPEILEYRSWLEQYFAFDRAEKDMLVEHDEFYENAMSNASWVTEDEE